MAEVLVEYTGFVPSEDGTRYLARACGADVGNGTWHGWLEFVDPDTGETIRSPRETTQPNRTDAAYWATGLTPVYLEGALRRARHPAARTAPLPRSTPAFDGPADPATDADAGPAPESILNPFSAYRKGEPLLRSQLAALSVRHLVNIIRAHGLSDRPSSTLEGMPPAELIDAIVRGVKAGNSDGGSQ